jgi:hypothetical protein
MAKSIITTDFPTPEEVAAFYRIPPKRVAELEAIIAESPKFQAAKAAAKRKAQTRAKKK